MRITRRVRSSWPAALLLALLASGGLEGQQPAGSPLDTLPDGPQVFTSGGRSYRVVPMKGLVRPFALAFLPNGDILITERGGRLRIVRNGVLDPREITGMPAVLHRQMKGLQDIALHPGFAENRLIYFTYSKPRDDKVATAALGRARFDGGSAVTDVRDLLVSDAWTDQPQASRLVFGRDGMVYMSIGVPIPTTVPGTVSPRSAQDPATHAGKILRLNDDGTVPADNPFVGRQGYRPEIFALGIRNSLGLIVHPTTGEIWESENGPLGGDEVNIIRAGKNYGWPIISYGRSYTGDRTEGTGPSLADPSAPGLEQPELFWSPSIALSGMVIYTGDRFPSWKGHLFVGGLVGAQLQRVPMNARGLPGRPWERLIDGLKQRIREVRQGPDGLLYLLTDEDAGAMLRIEPVD